MDVVVDQAVAVLQVLALRDAVRGEHHVDLTLGPLLVGEVLGPRGEAAQHVLESEPGDPEGVGPAAIAGDLGALEAQLVLERAGQLVEQVVHRVGEGGEDQHLAVAGVVGI